MGAPYESVEASGYNANPPPDDGTQSAANRVKWATIKSKLADVLKALADGINANVLSAFEKVVGGAGITSTAVNYTVQDTDQGKLVRATVAGITVTSPDATDVGDPFVFAFLNDSSGDVTFDGSGSQTVDGDVNVTVPAGCGFVIYTDGTNWFTTGQNFQRTQVAPQGYLSLVPEATDALSPVPAADQSAKTAVYYRTDKGNLAPIPDGTNFSVRAFSELTLTLVSNHVASSIYDVFLFDDAGTLRIGTGPAWNTVTAGSGARGSGAGTTELARLKGLPVNANQITVRNGSTTYTVAARCGLYLGSLYMDGTNGQISCLPTYGTSRKWGVWNYYNRREIILKAGSATSSNAYNTQTLRAALNESANAAAVFCGVADQAIEVKFAQKITVALANNVGSTATARIGIGRNSTSAASGLTASIGSGNSGSGGGVVVGTTSVDTAVARYSGTQTLGLDNFTALEEGTGVSNVTTTFFGTATNMELTARYMG